MSFELKEPILIVGIGGVGSKLATSTQDTILTKSDCLLVSHDRRDLEKKTKSDSSSSANSNHDNNDDDDDDKLKTIHISTKSLINPSYQTIRGFALESADYIKEQISGYSTIILMANLAGKTGEGIAPVISSICKQQKKNLMSFAVMPFNYQKDKIFASGISLKRIRSESTCTVIVDNDAMLQNNPDLTTESCYTITNSAIKYIIKSLTSGNTIHPDTNVLTASKSGTDIETSLRDSLKMLHGCVDTTPNSTAIKSSVIHVVGGNNNIPIGMFDTISKMTQDVVGQSAAISIETLQHQQQNDNSTKTNTVAAASAAATTTDNKNIVMLSTIQENTTGNPTKFDQYDPLGVIPKENTLDFDTMDCSYDCKLDNTLQQLEQ